MFDEVGFGGMFDMMNPQGNPLEMASMLAHQPEGLIPQLAAEGITPSMFEQRFPEFMPGGGGMTSGQLLSGSGVLQRYPQFDEGRLGAEGAIVPTPVRTQSFTQQPLAGQPAAAPGAPMPGQLGGAVQRQEVAADTGAAPATDAAPAPGAAPAAAANPAMDAKAQGEKKVADLVKLLSGLKMPAAPQLQQLRPGTAAPPAPRALAPQSGIAMALMQALSGGRPVPTLGAGIRR